LDQLDFLAYNQSSVKTDNQQQARTCGWFTPKRRKRKQIFKVQYNFDLTLKKLVGHKIVWKMFT
jgi:hypothetical protein